MRLVLLFASLASFGLLATGSPASSQEPTDDSLNGPSPAATDTLELGVLSTEELALLRAGAVPAEALDPWRNGSSASEDWAARTADNLSAQEVEFRRIGLEAKAAVARTEVAGRALASSVNRSEILDKRLRALVIDSFVNGEADALDRLSGGRARLYIDAPVESATETIVATSERVAVATDQHRTGHARRIDASDQVQTEERLQSYIVDEALQLDATARRSSLQHAARLRDRFDQTIAVSGEAPETVLVRGFRVAPEIAEPLEAMLTAAASPVAAAPQDPPSESLEEGLDGEAESSREAPAVPVILEGWGYRSTEEQVTLRLSHCGYSGYAIFDGPSPACFPPTARPLHSEHEKGLALDFTQDGAILNSNSSGFRWLQANAGNYGFINLPSEPWHWSTTGH